MLSASFCPVFQTPAILASEPDPKVMTPTANRETISPVLPTREYCMASSPEDQGLSTLGKSHGMQKYGLASCRHPHRARSRRNAVPPNAPDQVLVAVAIRFHHGPGVRDLDATIESG